MKAVLERLSRQAQYEDLVRVLESEEPQETSELFAFADRIRSDSVGDGIRLHGIVEFSNFCRSDCPYCGLNRTNDRLQRYRLSAEEIATAVAMIAHADIRTVVLQSGEDDGLDAEWLAEVVRGIKSRFGLAVTLSVGVRSTQEYRLWREAGAERYLLKMETSDQALSARLQALDELKEFGYQVGSGVTVGIPGQTADILVRNLLFIHEQRFEMLGIGSIPDQSVLIPFCLKVVALARILSPRSHIQITAAADSLSGDRPLEGLEAGANVLMPDFTPFLYRRLTESYPHRPCAYGPAGSCVSCMRRRAESSGRYLDFSRAAAAR